MDNTMEETNLQWTETLRDGARVRIRAIRPTDKAADLAFIQELSDDSRRMRFLGQVGSLGEADLRRLTEIDYDRDMAFVAICEDDDRIVGVSRYSGNGNGDGAECECAVAVADDWQGVGLGVALMRHLIQAARAHGFRRMRSLDFAANAEMRELARFLGFTTRLAPGDPAMVIHELALA